MKTYVLKENNGFKIGNKGFSVLIPIIGNKDFIDIKIDKEGKVDHTEYDYLLSIEGKTSIYNNTKVIATLSGLYMVYIKPSGALFKKVM